MRQQEQGVKPVVKIKYHRALAGSDLITALSAGLEEQAVPFELIAVEGNSISQSDLGLQAAGESPLRLGLAVDSSGNIGLYQAQVGDEPLFQLTRASVKQARELGENTGRLVRRVPLKNIEETR